MKKIAIISPSGNLYGSEQVLSDFLQTTIHQYDVYVPMGLLSDLLKKNSKHRIILFSSIKRLYLELTIKLILSKYDGVYINEAGHIKYLNLLSCLFPNKIFYTHIRLLEDTKRDRIKKERSNIKYISVSNYITQAVQENCDIKAVTIRDLYNESSYSNEIKKLTKGHNIIKIGVIGRVTDTKGLQQIEEFCNYIELQNDNIELIFFGAVNDESSNVSRFIDNSKTYKRIKCIFKGFIKNKDSIYGNVDMILHFNQYESLGRIFFEALDYGLPIIGFNKGGIGEIAECLGLYGLMIDPSDPQWTEIMYSTIKSLSEDSIVEKFDIAKNQIQKHFSSETYTKEIENLFYE